MRPGAQALAVGRGVCTLFVEGKDEENLCRKLLSHLATEERISIVAAGGKDRFPEQFQAFQTNVMHRKIPALGVLRDADQSAESAFQSIRDAIDAAGLKPPSRHATFSDGDPSVGIFVVPDGASPGAVETLCRRSVEQGHVARCAARFLECLQEDGRVRGASQLDKTFAHVYLAAGRNPVARVGEGALQGAWDFEAEAFAELRGFITELASRARLPG